MSKDRSIFEIFLIVTCPIWLPAFVVVALIALSGDIYGPLDEF